MTILAILTLLLCGLSHSLVQGVNPRLNKPRQGNRGKEHFGANPNANQLFAAPPLNAPKLNAEGWTATCDSQETGNECYMAIDGDNSTFWHTQWRTANPPPPHTITIDMGSAQNIKGVSALPRQDGNQNGMIARHEIFVSTDGNTWQLVAIGNWPVDDLTKFANFETVTARYVRITALTEINGNPWTSIAEVGIYDAQAAPTPYTGLGKWGPTINFPTVPVAGMVDPLSGKITIWSSYAYDNYIGSTNDRVFTSIWDPATNDVEPKIVDDTDHDMFCPGISIDGYGQVIVTGGNSDYKTTIYDFPSQSWSPAADMNIPRGYQASATCADGRVFTIGGSWSGGEVEPKNGEIYDPKTNTWTLLADTFVSAMLTNDAQGTYRADNHGWLFGWKEDAVFQAGPSTAMNWYYTGYNGNTVSAGNRASNRGVAPDSMCGIAVMYDAVNGKILTAGGSPSYQYSNAHTDAHLITIGNPGTSPQVAFASNGLWFARAFGTAVVLPDGKTFITGVLQDAAKHHPP
ncbi:hypothetical protein NQ176_g9846 [Zarea fungicola]|uniref:Uncharacterized protein n=1 Tax=Zarea fungicola TaxID=93591 RepID=A0ACC1MJ68_9HYPO|nr:hypothetical protein NQ176_g9846 [Lecanicillium fungicola]